MSAPLHLISRNLDPVFALFIGIGAAATRINREEKELGRDTKETVDSLFRYVFLCHLLYHGGVWSWRGEMGC